MKENLIQKIKDLKEEKKQAVLDQSFEKAAGIRDIERGLLSKLKEYPEYKELYNGFLQEKVKEFEKLITIKDGRGVLDFFDYAIKNVGSDYFEYSKKTYMEFDMNCYDLVHLRKYPDNEVKKIKEEDTKFLNKWILKNLVSYDDWFYSFIKENI